MDYARLQLKRRMIFALLVLALAVAAFIIRSSTTGHQAGTAVAKVQPVRHPAPAPDPKPAPTRRQAPHDACDPSSAAFDQSKCSPGTYHPQSLPRPHRAHHAHHRPAETVQPDTGSRTDSGGSALAPSATVDTPAPAPQDNGGSGGPSNPCDASSYDLTACDASQGKKTTTDSTCDSNYAGACVPIGVGNTINCSDVNGKNFKSVGSDPYKLDADGDGIACEGN